jgi:hypothetical protein
MDTKLRQVSSLLKRYDSDLFPRRYLDGTLGIMRKRRDYDFYRFNQEKFVLWFARDWEDLVLPCTDNWIETGRPVDWGIEPILSQIQKSDAWRDDGDYDRFVKSRDQIKQNKQIAFKNNVRALAADCRKEFAKATNDINTSSLDKGDSFNGNRR